MKEIIGKITTGSLTVLKEKKINILRASKNEKEKKKVASEWFKTNQWFDLDEGSFYKHLTNIVKATGQNSKPKFKSRENETITTKDEIEKFWRPIWENSSYEVHQDDWIRSVETALKQLVKFINNSLG